MRLTPRRATFIATHPPSLLLLIRINIPLFCVNVLYSEIFEEYLHWSVYLSELQMFEDHAVIMYTFAGTTVKAFPYWVEVKSGTQPMQHPTYATRGFTRFTPSTTTFYY